MGVPYPQKIVGPLLLEEGVDMAPHGLVELGVPGVVIGAVHAPVAVHLVVEPEQHRLAEALQLPAVFPEEGVVLAVEDVVDDADVVPPVHGLQGQLHHAVVVPSPLQLVHRRRGIQGLVTDQDIELVVQLLFQALQIGEVRRGAPGENAPPLGALLPEGGVVVALQGLRKAAAVSGKDPMEPWLADFVGEPEALQDPVVDSDGGLRLDGDRHHLLGAPQELRHEIVVLVLGHPGQLVPAPGGDVDADAVDGGPVVGLHPVSGVPGEAQAVVDIGAGRVDGAAEIVVIDLNAGAGACQHRLHRRHQGVRGEVPGVIEGIALGVVHETAGAVSVVGDRLDITVPVKGRLLDHNPVHIVGGALAGEGRGGTEGRQQGHQKHQLFHGFKPHPEIFRVVMTLIMKRGRAIIRPMREGSFSRR